MTIYQIDTNRTLVQAWGRGIERIIIACKNDGFSMPEFR